MRVRSPVGEVRVPLARGARPSGGLQGKVIGILNDDFGRDYCQHLRALLLERYGPADVRYWHKPHNNSPSPQSLVDEVASQVDLAIVGVAA